MQKTSGWINKRSFLLYSLAFFLMALPPVGLYFAAQAGAQGWMVALLGLIVVGNILVLLPK